MSASGDRAAGACPCGSGLGYAACCQRFHQRKAQPETAEQLMRSRYSAYFFREVDYLVETTHPDTRAPSLRRELEESIDEARWLGLSILSTSQGGKEDKTGKVAFVAEYVLADLARPLELRERSRFKRHKGAWKYLDADG